MRAGILIEENPREKNTLLSAIYDLSGPLKEELNWIKEGVFVITSYDNKKSFLKVEICDKDG